MEALDIEQYNYTHNYSFCYENGSCAHAIFHYQEHEEGGEKLTSKDAAWILTSAIIIFTMQTGFGLLEAGSVHVKSEVNIMMKNSLDVIFGGITYWAFGFGFSFGEDEGHEAANSFIGVGHYFLHVAEGELGFVYALFLFQLSFATTSTTIVSGCMVERTELLSYNMFSLCMTFVYTIPAHWMWGKGGFLMELGVQDIAGCGPVHLVGGVTGIVATLILGPRLNAFESEKREPAPSPLKCILGMFMLWWGWLRFNAGSVFIVSDVDHWTHAVRAGVNTIIASIGGGFTSVCSSLLLYKYANDKYPYPYDCGIIVNGILGSLVGITAACTFVEPFEALFIGSISVFLTIITEIVVGKLRIDDPVGVIPVHTVCGAWGLLAVGLFLQTDESMIEGQGGVFRTGQFYMLGVQFLAIVSIVAWTAFFSFSFLKIIELAIGLRLPAEDELLGADLVEHGVGSVTVEEHKAADAVMSISVLSKSTKETELKYTMANFFKQYYHPQCSNELSMTMTQLSETGLALEIQLKGSRPSPSLELGVITERDQPEDEEIKDPATKKVIQVGPRSTEVHTTDEMGVLTSVVIPYSDKHRRGSSSGMEAGVCAGVY